MHILYLTSGLYFGGAQNIVVGLAEEAVARGHEASILTVCPGNDYEDRLQAAGIPLYSIEYEGSFSPQKLLDLVRCRRNLLKEVRALSPDIVHVHLFIPKLLLFGVHDAAGVPVVLTEQDNSPWWRRKGIVAATKRIVDRMFVHRTAQFTVAISQSVKDDLISYLNAPKEQVSVIYNFFSEPASGIPSKGSQTLDDGMFKLFMITRLVREKKGLDTALDIMQSLQQKNSHVRLVVVGDGPDREWMEQESKRRGLAHLVEFRGYKRDVWAQYAEADVLLMPSRWEGFGITASEAAAVGVPVVGSRVGGLQEVIIDDQTGFTCEPEDVQQFVDSVERLISDPALLQKMSEAATDASSRFRQDQSFVSYEKVYRLVAAAR